MPNAREHDDSLPDRAILRTLIRLRWVSITAQLVVILAVHYGLGVTLPITALGLIIAALLLWNIASQAWLVHARDNSLTLSLQLLADVAALTALLYFTGGPVNPFISLYLVPIALAAATLSTRHALWITASTALAYTALLRWHRPLPQLHGNEFQLHVLGMWVNFLLAAAILTLFVAALARLLRSRERELSGLREARMRDEQLLALGTLAASTTHALGTPLNTLSIGIEELRSQRLPPAEADAELAVMQQQIATCREHLDELRQGAQHKPAPQNASTFMHQCLSAWQALHRQVTLALDDQLDQRARLLADDSLRHALTNLLDNAARASRQCGHARIDVGLARCSRFLRIHIDDHGPGISAEALRNSLEGRGGGLGLLLSHASIERLGGEVSLDPGPAGGTRTRVRLPLLDTGA